MSDHKYQCNTKQCDREAAHYCICHQCFVCDRCNGNRHYGCDLMKICHGKQLRDISKLLHDFVDGLKNKAAQYDLVENIQGLEQALQDVNDVVKMFQANVAQCFEQDKHVDFSKLVFQGKQILSDIFEGTIFGNIAKSNPILRLLFDSQVLDTQNGYLIPPMGDIEALVNLKSKDLVRKLAKRNKESLEKRKLKELIEAQREVEERLKTQYLPHISELGDEINELRMEIFEANKTIKSFEDVISKKNKKIKEEIAKKSDFYLELNNLQSHSNHVHTTPSKSKNKNPETSRFSDYTHFAKIILVGASSIGKTCIIHRIAGGDMPTSFFPTIGVDFKLIKRTFGERKLKLQIWDSAGNNRFQECTEVYVAKAQCIFLVYDITEVKSFKRLESWIKVIRKDCTDDVITYLIGNKNDLGKEREISFESAAEFKTKHDLDFYFEVSAKTNEGIEELCQHACKQLIMQIDSNLKKAKPKKKKRFILF
ncbi:unnamed protein product [Moneuplotes crassus]|uniref:Uncharacterized protein n=1 Tax=Euplotes crassus TaxID=5936 RepID=A0AAD1UFK2_EUPCR|nr:unnamed protein product [Moneuplotes crassus]